MKKIIEFVARDEFSWEVAPKPYPAKEALPNWWRKMTPYEKSPDSPDGKKLVVKNFRSNASAKKCTPMLDIMITGYIIPLWADVQIEFNNDEPYISWKIHSNDIFQIHGRQSREVNPPTGYHPQAFKFMNKWIPKTPKGYSTLITQPFGWRDTPFQAIPAIVDTDTSSLEIIPPVWIKKDFNGIVEKGTPMIQLIPFKRDNWKAEFSFLKDGEYQKLEDRNFNGTIINHYIKNHWVKKEFN